MSAELLEVTASGASAAAVAAIFLGASYLVRQWQINQRVHNYVALEAPVHPKVVETPDRPPADIATGLNRRLTRSTLGAKIQARLVRAGLTLKASEFILMQLATAGATSLFSWLVAPGESVSRLVVMGAGGLVGLVAPLLVLSLLERRRLDKFEKQLPQAINSMAGALQAGSTIAQATELIAREMMPPISQEFRRLLREVELGLSYTEAMANLVQRMPSSDLLLLSSAISIQNRVGGDLAEILRSISHTIRERLRIRSEINVLTAQGRYSAYLITALPVLLFLYLYFTRYDYASQLFLPGITRVLLIAGIAGIVFGYYAMKRIITIDV